MSSHREAPEISKDPVADNADVYAFVSPDTRHRHDPQQLRPAAGPGRRPELLRVRRRRPLPDLHRQRRRRDAGDRVPVPVHVDAAEPEHVPLQHRADRVARRPELERPPVLRGRPVRRRARRAAKHGRTTPSTPTPRARAGVPKGRTARQLVANAPCPPCNIGPRSTPNYEQSLAAAACRRSRQRREGVLPASGTSRSTSTSARSSTSAGCGRSESRT